jgi:hypothetical protein
LLYGSNQFFLVRAFFLFFVFFFVLFFLYNTQNAPTRLLWLGRFLFGLVSLAGLNLLHVNLAVGYLS